MTRLRFLLLILLIPVATTSAQESLPLDEAIFGNIAPDIRTVDFLLNASAGQVYQVEVVPNAPDLAPQFTLMQDNDALGVWYALNAGETLSAQVTVAETGTYRIRVSAGGAGAQTGPFSITVSVADEALVCLGQPGITPLGGTNIIIMPIGDMSMTETDVISGIPQVRGLETGETTCDGTLASLLLMQSSNGRPQRARVNGALIEFTGVIAVRANNSTEAFGTETDDNPPVLHLIVLDGTATVDETVVEAGNTIMSAADSQSGERLLWVGERPLTTDELAQLQPLTDIDMPMPR